MERPSLRTRKSTGRLEATREEQHNMTRPRAASALGTRALSPAMQTRAASALGGAGFTTATLLALPLPRHVTRVPLYPLY